MSKGPSLIGEETSSSNGGNPASILEVNGDVTSDEKAAGAPRSAVLQSCTLTSGLLVAAGLVLREVNIVFTVAANLVFLLTKFQLLGIEFLVNNISMHKCSYNTSHSKACMYNLNYLVLCMYYVGWQNILVFRFQSALLFVFRHHTLHLQMDGHSLTLRLYHVSLLLFLLQDE